MGNFKARLQKEIEEYKSLPITSSSLAMIGLLYDTVNKVGKDCKFGDEEIAHWNKIMQNVDGTQGGHWTVEQTTSVAKSNGVEFTHITPEMWNVTMNMMYSDYYNVALKHGVNTAEFFADMAKAFLFDKDGGSPKEKLSAYYHNIVDREPEK